LALKMAKNKALEHVTAKATHLGRELQQAWDDVAREQDEKELKRICDHHASVKAEWAQWESVALATMKSELMQAQNDGGKVVAEHGDAMSTLHSKLKGQHDALVERDMKIKRVMVECEDMRQQQEASQVSEARFTELEEQTRATQAITLGDHGQELARLASLHAAALSARDAAVTDAQEELSQARSQHAQDVGRYESTLATAEAELRHQQAELQAEALVSQEVVRRKSLEFAKTSSIHLAELERVKQELAEVRQSMQEMERQHAAEKEAWQGGYDELEQDLIAVRERQTRNAADLGRSVLTRGASDELRSKVAVCSEEILRRDAMIQGLEQQRTEAKAAWQQQLARVQESLQETQEELERLKKERHAAMCSQAAWQQQLARVQESLRETQEELERLKKERDAAMCSQVENQRALETAWTKADELMHQESQCAKALGERTAEYHAAQQDWQRRIDESKSRETAGWDLAENVKADSERAIAMCRAELAAERRRSEELEASNEAGKVAACVAPSKEPPCAKRTNSTPMTALRAPTLLEAQVRSAVKGWDGHRGMLKDGARSNSPPLTQDSRMQQRSGHEFVHQRLAALEKERKQQTEELRRHTENLRRQVEVRKVRESNSGFIQPP